MPIQTIVVPSDFSADAECALQWAIELAWPEGARIHLLHCCFIGPRFGVIPEPLPVPIELWTELRTRALEQLLELEKKVAAAGLIAQSRLCEQPPIPAIIEYAASRSADLIVMGTRGSSGLSHALLGSVAERVIQLAPCPVLTVKAEHRPRS